jgi:predicted nucleic acid-binding protein
MILVDTSVLINYLKGGGEDKTLLFGAVLSRGVPFGISSYTFQEVLQGAKSDTEFELLKEYLCTQRIYRIPQELKTFETAARMYRDLRRNGITPRSAIDIHVAVTAIMNGLALLHDDRDFDAMASVVKDLRILNRL